MTCPTVPVLLAALIGLGSVLFAAAVVALVLHVLRWADHWADRRPTMPATTRIVLGVVCAVVAVVCLVVIITSPADNACAASMSAVPGLLGLLAGAASGAGLTVAVRSLTRRSGTSAGPERVEPTASRAEPRDRPIIGPGPQMRAEMIRAGADPDDLDDIALFAAFARLTRTLQPEELTTDERPI